MNKILSILFDTLSIIATLTIFFVVMVIGFISLGLPALLVIFLISVFV
jgi:hypothetical protein